MAQLLNYCTKQCVSEITINAHVLGKFPIMFLKKTR